jgi:hypothetical protein
MRSLIDHADTPSWQIERTATAETGHGKGSAHASLLNSDCQLNVRNYTITWNVNPS